MKKSFKKLLLLMAVVVTAVVCLAFSAEAEKWGDYECWGDYEYVTTNFETGDIKIWGYTGKETSVTIPSKINGKKVVALASYAFQGNEAIKSVTIPDSVTSIGYYTFDGCTGLTSITIPDSVTSMGNYAFSGCTGLKSITISDGVTVIGYYAFEGCTGLTSITLPDSVTAIGDSAFSGCTGLKSITISDGVTSIGKAAFSNTAYYNEESNWKNKVLYIGNHLITAKSDISGSYAIKAGTKKIASHAFAGCDMLTSITIPDSITKIDAYAFTACAGLKSITIPDSVTEIGTGAFWSCSSLASITIPDSVTSIGWYVFYHCTSLTSITIPDSVTEIGYDAFYNTGYYNDETNWKNKVLYIGNHLILAKYDVSGSYAIKIGTKTIASYAFDGREGLTSITIPDSVTSIGSYAFCNCTSLTNIKIPDSVTEIGDGTFNNTGYYNDESNWENKMLYIGNHLTVAKYDISGSNVIKAGTKTIARRAFAGCDMLTSITIPNGVTSIGDSTFEYCAGLTSITIPESITKIGCSAFGGCDTLQKVYYGGFKTQWERVEIYEGNEPLSKATIHYKPCPHTNLSTLKEVAATCTKEGKTEGKKCSVCGEITVAQKTVAKKSHTYKTTTTKATLTKNGKTVTKCSECGEVKSTTTVYYPKTITLSKTEYTYNGKVQKPTITVKDSKGNTLKKDTDYTVTYEKGRKNPGKYSVRIDFMGKYSGTKRVYFTIAPATPVITKTAQTTNAIRLTWNKVTGATGYRVYQYNSKTKKWDKLKTLKDTTYRIEKLKAGTTYKFRVKAYKKDDGTIWGKATATITVATKLPAPTGIKTAQNTSAINLTWNKVAGADGYRVYMYNASTKKWVNQKTLTATSLMVKNLKAGTTYKFKIIAYKKVSGKAIWGDYTAVINASTRTVTPKITAVASTAKGRAAVAWSNVAGESGYELWASTKKDTGYKKIVTAKANVTKGVRTGLVSGRTYYFKVRTFRTVGNTTVYSTFSAANALKIK